MKIVSIYHREQFGDCQSPLVHVADISIEADMDVYDALEHAYARSQNIEGSWSRGPVINGQQNLDFDANIKRIAPLPVHDGRVYGLRSSSVGDVLCLDGRAYDVAGFGFKDSVEAPK
jgi:hypothetical protein